MHPIRYQTIDRGQSVRLRGTNQQTDVGLLFLNPTYRVGTGPGGPVTTTMRLKGIGLGGYAIHNRTGGLASVAIGVRIPNDLWIAGQWTTAGAFSDDTADAQTVGANDFALEDPVDNTGFVVACQVPFNAMSLNVGTADTGGVPVRAIRFSDPEGDAWEASPGNLFLQDGASGAYATGEQLLVWAIPPTWGKTQSAGLNGIPSGYYAVNVRATTAPTVSRALATAIELCQLFYLTEGLADNGVSEKDLAPNELLASFGDALVALVSRASGTADGQSRVTAQLRTCGA